MSSKEGENNENLVSSDTFHFVRMYERYTDHNNNNLAILEFNSFNIALGTFESISLN